MGNKTTAIRNTAKGARGFHSVDGYVELQPGESLDSVVLSADEYASAKRTGYFAFDGSDAADDEGDEPKALDEMTKAELTATAEAEGVDITKAKSNADKVAAIQAARDAKEAGGVPPTTHPTDDLDKMSDADLTATVAALTGKPAPEGATRDELLALARNPA